MSPALAGGFFTTRPPWKALNLVLNISSVLLHVFFFFLGYMCVHPLSFRLPHQVIRCFVAKSKRDLTF